MALFVKNKADSCDVVLQGALDALDTDVVVVQEKDGKLLFCNRAARQRAGAEEEYLTLFPGLLNQCPDPGAPKEAYPVSYDVEDRDGRTFSVHANKMVWLGGTPGVMLTLRDVDEERKVNHKLYNLAYLDSLTQVPNRLKLKEDFETITDDIQAGKCCGVVGIFDLDNFKGINDTYGHNTGDVMLRRLTEHLESEPAFKGHLYRLGGDEFVLWFSEQAGRFSGDEELQDYYQNLLSAAFLSYTMPNIELSCTLSMGVSMFPRHGCNYSELLRKADIALYKAKEGGRNRMVFFEEKYDNAKTFKDLYVNIQPILSAAGRTYGYELIDRGNEQNGDEDALSLSDFDRSLDTLGLGDMQNDTKYFIGNNHHLMSQTVQHNLPKDKFVVMVQLEKTPTQDDLAQYRALCSAGYSLCLAGLRDENAKPDVLEVARYAKLDSKLIRPESQQALIKRYPVVKFIACNVNTGAEYEAAQKRGFMLFQGFYFEQQAPVTKKTKDIDPLKMNYLRLLRYTSTDDYVDFREITAIISSDVALSYKLLRLLNSAAVGLRNKISSIDMAVAYLGEQSLKKWIAMLALRGIASDKPLELVRVSLIRAQFGELLCPHFAPPRDARHVFLVGLFSLLHIALEESREALLEEMPVADDIRFSLLTKTGPHSDLLQFFSDYEYSNWDAVSEFVSRWGLSDRLVSESYIQAVKWYNSLSEEADQKE